MAVADEIAERLQAGFAVRVLRVDDESESHRGHAGWRDGGETHFHVRLDAEELDGLSRIERHRRVHAVLGPALIGRIHALRLTLGQ